MTQQQEESILGHGENLDFGGVCIFSCPKQKRLRFVHVICTWSGVRIHQNMFMGRQNKVQTRSKV